VVDGPGVGCAWGFTGRLVGDAVTVVGLEVSFPGGVLGRLVGLRVGFTPGALVGAEVSLPGGVLGRRVGLRVGCTTGALVGAEVSLPGGVLGRRVGLRVGLQVGTQTTGQWVGERVGEKLGERDGERLGERVTTVPGGASRSSRASCMWHTGMSWPFSLLLRL
jgi:hypothetical protein